MVCYFTNPHAFSKTLPQHNTTQHATRQHQITAAFFRPQLPSQRLVLHVVQQLRFRTSQEQTSGARTAVTQKNNPPIAAANNNILWPCVQQTTPCDTTAGLTFPLRASVAFLCLKIKMTRRLRVSTHRLPTTFSQNYAGRRAKLSSYLPFILVLTGRPAAVLGVRLLPQ